MTAGYLFLREDRFLATGVEQTPSPPSGATHYEARAYSGGGAGGAVPKTDWATTGATSGAAASGGGAPGLSENMLRAIVAPMVLYPGKGGLPQTLSARFDNTYDGLPGEDSWIKENGIVVLKAQGGQGGNGAAASAMFGDTSDSQGVLHNTGNSIEGGGGGNHDYSTGDYKRAGASGYPGILLGNLRIMGGGASGWLGAGGKSSTSTGPGHGPSGGAIAYADASAHQGASGQDGEIIIRWYAQVSF